MRCAREERMPCADIKRGTRRAVSARSISATATVTVPRLAAVGSLARIPSPRMCPSSRARAAAYGDSNIMSHVNAQRDLRVARLALRRINNWFTFAFAAGWKAHCSLFRTPRTWVRTTPLVHEAQRHGVYRVIHVRRRGACGACPELLDMAHLASGGVQGE